MDSQHALICVQSKGVLSQMSERDRSVVIGGPLFELLIRCHGNTAEPGSSHSAAKAVFDKIIGPVDNGCLSAILHVYSSVSMWEDAIMLVSLTNCLHQPLLKSIPLCLHTSC